MSGRIDLQIVTPERLLLEEEVDEVIYRSTEGYLGILPGHLPMLTSLAIGELTYRVGSQTYRIAVSSGFVEVLPDRVIVLADRADLPHEIDASGEQSNKSQAEERMKNHTAEEDFQAELEKIEEAVVRISVASQPHH